MKPDLYSLPLNLGNELIIDNFAGGGGTSTGLEAAFGRPVDIAINHDPEALAMHAANHPHTKHLCESVWDIDPIQVTNNQPVGLVWLSPDCKHFSKAKGGKPVEKRIRGLAWVALRWAAKCKPRVIMLENVEEFKTWGPLIIDEHGHAKPDPAKKGKTFDSFIRQLKGHGYEVDYFELRACDFGAPTIRKRFFLVARRDGIKIQKPRPTHGAPDSIGVQNGKLLPYRTAADCIDWSLPCPSIFDRKKPLAEKTLARVAKGIMRYVVEASDPFIMEDIGACLIDAAHGEVSPSGVKRWGKGAHEITMPMGTVTTSGNKAITAAYLSPYYSDKRPSDARGQLPTAPINTVPTENRHALVTALLTEHANSSNQRVMPVDEPLRTICAQVKGGHFSLISAHITKFRSGAVGTALDEPLHTVTAGGKQARPGTGNAMGIITSNLVKLRGQNVGQATDAPLATISAGGQHHAEVRAFLLSYYGNEKESNSVDKPVRTVTSRDRFGLVTIKGQDYQIVDIGLRMLAPRELYRAQGFPESYIIGDDPEQGLSLTKSAQVRMCGNSVCPPVALALIEANFKHEQQLARVA